MSLLWQKRYVTPYELHKQLINHYVLKNHGDAKFLTRDSSGDKTDYDVIRENHRFLWEGDSADSWEERLARKYYDKLFKEYCIGDLSRYKENKIALRWRTEQEVISGKGQFICGNKRCDIEENLRTWEVNFAYQEKGEKKNALVKIRLCPDCSKKLNYHSKKREVKRLSRRSSHHKHKHKHQDKDNTHTDKKSEDNVDDINNSNSDLAASTSTNQIEASPSPWETRNIAPETKSREDEMEDYLHDLLL